MCYDRPTLFLSGYLVYIYRVVAGIVHTMRGNGGGVVIVGVVGVFLFVVVGVVGIVKVMQ